LDEILETDVDDDAWLQTILTSVGTESAGNGGRRTRRKSRAEGYGPADG
jgi:hypothetical protein